MSKDVVNKGVFTLGYLQLAMPIDEALAALRLFGNAEKIERKYESNGYVYYIGGELPEMGVQLMSDATYAEGKLNGAKT